MTDYKNYVQSSGDHFCVGLDPHQHHMSSFLKKQMDVDGVEEFLWKWCSAIVRSTSHCASIYKIQSSFYEAYGDIGFRVMKRIAQIIKEQKKFVILDAKRCDISSTMNAYGMASTPAAVSQLVSKDDPSPAYATG